MDDCLHKTYQDCMHKGCDYYKNSPWVCVARFHPTTYPLRETDKVILKDYGLQLTADDSNCPRYVTLSRRLANGEDISDFRDCPIHYVLKNAKICKCNLWKSGCQCGVFKAEIAKQKNDEISS